MAVFSVVSFRRALTAIRRQRVDAFRPPCRRGASQLFAAACCAALIFCRVGTTAGQSVWELSPYRVRLLSAVETSPVFTPEFCRSLDRSLEEQVNTLIGPLWRVSIEHPEPLLHQAILKDLERISPASAPPPTTSGAGRGKTSAPSSKEQQPPASAPAKDRHHLIDPALYKEDKLFLVGLSEDEQGYLLTGRELDLRTRVWGTVVSRITPHKELIPQEMFRLLTEIFAPLAQVEDVNLKEKTASLRIRGGALPPRDNSISFTGPGTLFRPLIRRNDRRGEWMLTQTVPWTFVYTEQVEGSLVRGKLYSGIRGALTTRQRGRTESLALAVKPADAPTRLIVESRAKPARRLAGYEVHAYGPTSPETVLLGRTDRLGEIDIPPGAIPLRIVVVKNGGELLARLPLMPGLDASLTAAVPDDDYRLKAEGVIAGLQETLIDLVARREVLMHRTRSLTAEKKLDEARKLLDELRTLRTRDQFADVLRQERRRLVSPDPLIQAKIEKMFIDTESLLGRFLDPGELTKLEAELRQASQGSETKAAQPAAG